MGCTITHQTITTIVAVCAVAALTPAAAAVAAPVTTTGPVTATGRVTAIGPVAATAIVLERSGGFAGTRDSFVVDQSTAGGRRSLRMAGSPEFRRLHSSYQPANACCDRFFYRVTVTYRSGRHKTVSTVQGATAPRILGDVIAEVERAGVRPLAPAAGS